MIDTGAVDDRVTISGILRFFRRNARRIALLAAAIFTLGVVVLLVLPVNYAATALVIVDPREQRVTTDQDVLPGIGQDAAALQSLVEIAKSDGFLEPLVEKLKVADDHEIAGSETNPSRILEKFRKHLEISRRGLTYVIAMTFVSKDPQRAAYYANAVAEAFVASQSQGRATATDEAADWLNSRLKALSDRLRASEDAVAAFKTQYRIVDAGRESTTRQLRVTELTQQASAARLQAEEAKNRYEQAQRDLKSNVDGSTGSRSDLLGILRGQLTQLSDQVAQKEAVLGSRHPDLVMSHNQLADLRRRIEVERQRNIANAKSDYESSLDKQRTLERQLKDLESEMLVDGQAAVKLQELRREADANRAIYEQFLARYNATNQQRLLQSTQTKVASLAIPPTRPTRPPLALLLVALAVASVGGATGIAALTAPRTRSESPPEPAAGDADDSPTAAEAAEPRDETAAVLKAASRVPILARIPELSGLQHAALTPHDDGATLRPYLRDVLDAIGVATSGPGKVVLVTSVTRRAGNSAIVRALNAEAVERGLLSVAVDVAADSKFAEANRPVAGVGQVRALTTSVRSVLRLLTVEPDVSVQGGLRSEFDLVLLDAPSLTDHPEIAEICRHSDYNLLVVNEASTDAAGALEAQQVLARSSPAGPIGIVMNTVRSRAAVDQTRYRAGSAG